MSNTLYVGGNFEYAEGIRVNGTAIWDGTNWDSVGTGYKDCNVTCGNQAMTMYQGALYVSMPSIGIFSGGIAKWNGVTWDSLGLGVFGNVMDMTVYSDTLYVVGMFTNAGGLPAYDIAKWSGINWSNDFKHPFTSNLIGITSIEVFQNNIYVGGLFNDSTGTLRNIAMWSGNNWLPLGTGIISGSLEPAVNSIVSYNDTIYVAGRFNKQEGNVGNNIMGWDGTNWFDLNNGTDGAINEMIVIEDNLYVVGSFSNAGGIPAQNIAKWDGAEWCGFGSSFDNELSTIADHNDTIYIGGHFTEIDGNSVSRIARWTGGDFTDSCGVYVGADESSLLPATKISIYPNPTTGLITVAGLPQEATKISVYNIL
ncbi:MAG: hypothetical protein JKX73_07085, partial [Flavobacteriales bacterium]|nr:hypothetical protein [Flavobacteriales bacterium]